MNAYRGAPQKAARRRFEFRARGSGIPLLAVIVFGGVAAILFVERVYVSCSRVADRCTFGEVSALSLQRHVIPLSTIGGLEVEKTDRSNLTRLVFSTASGRMPVTSSSDAVFEAERRRISSAFTSWLGTRRESFDEGYGPHWGVLAAIVIALGLAIANVWRGGATARVVYDALTDTVIITQRDSALSPMRRTELHEPRVRVWKRMIEIHDEHGNIVPLPARETDPQARGLSTVLERD